MERLRRWRQSSGGKAASSRMWGVPWRGSPPAETSGQGRHEVGSVGQQGRALGRRRRRRPSPAATGVAQRQPYLWRRLLSLQHLEPAARAGAWRGGGSEERGRSAQSPALAAGSQATAASAHAFSVEDAMAAGVLGWALDWFGVLVGAWVTMLLGEADDWCVYTAGRCMMGRVI